MEGSGGKVEDRSGRGQSISPPPVCLLWHLLHGCSSDPAVVSAPAGQPATVPLALTAGRYF